MKHVELEESHTGKTVRSKLLTWSERDLGWGSWRGGSVVQNICYSSGFNSQHSHDNLHPSVSSSTHF